MSKETFYFSHDYNARTDEKIKKLIRKHGMIGYGIYWAIIEDLYNNDNDIELDIDQLAFDYRVDNNIIKSIIEDFNLFIINDGYFGSESIQRRKDQRSEKSRKAKESAELRWEKSRKYPNEEVSDYPQVYILRLYDENESFIKIGHTTTKISRRFGSKLPYKYEILGQFFTDEYTELEVDLNNKLIDHQYTPQKEFGGYLECYTIDSLKVLNSIDINTLPNCSTSSHIFANSRNAIKERKGKENKVKDIKRNNNSDFEIVFREYLEMRKKIRKPATPLAVDLIKKKLSKISTNEQTQIKILEQSIENSWQSVFPLKEQSRSKIEAEKNQTVKSNVKVYG